MATSRSNTINLFNDRFGKLGLANAGGLYAAWTWLSRHHEWYEYLLILPLIAFAIYLNTLGFDWMKEANERVDRWSRKMNELEVANGIQGGVKIFSDETVDIARLGTAFDVKTLTILVWIVITLWAGTAVYAIYLATTSGGLKWISLHLLSVCY